MWLIFPPFKRIQDSLGFWIPSCRFRIPGTRFGVCEWNLDSGFHELYSGFQNPFLSYSVFDELHYLKKP